jgi:hypothetical protein
MQTQLIKYPFGYATNPFAEDIEKKNRQLAE